VRQAREAVERILGLHGDGLNRRDLVLQPARRADEGSGRPETCDEMGEASGSLLEDLDRRAFVVRTHVGRV
jgi:hypothetical protein